MKIKKKTIVNFLKEVHMGEVNKCLLCFEENGLRINTKSLASTHNAYGFLSKEQFEEYTKLGNVGIDDLATLIEIFSRMGETIDFTIKGNLLIMKGTKMELQVPLLDEKFIDEVKEIKNMEFETTFSLEVKRIKKFLNDASNNKNFKIIIETVDEGVKIYNTGKFKFTYNEDAENAKKGSIVKFGNPFEKIFKSIEGGNVTIHMKTHYPMKIEHETEEYKVNFFLAPIIEKE